MDLEKTFILIFISSFFLITPVFSDEITVGSQIFVKSPMTDVIITFGGNEPNSDIQIALLQPENLILGTLDKLPLNSKINLQKFKPGDELVFYITNKSSPQFTYFTGPPDRNPDNIVHVRIINYGSFYRIGFEETYGGGDLDFNDVVFFLNGDLSLVPIESQPEQPQPFQPPQSPYQSESTNPPIKPDLFPVFILLMVIIPIFFLFLIKSHEPLPFQTIQPQSIHPDDPFMISDIDSLEGEYFEFFLKLLFEKQGYSVSMTPKSNDKGADLILTDYNKKTVIQAKRQIQSVGHRAIEQAHYAKTYYNADQAWVITSSYYTSQAIESAAVSSTRLFNRDDLIQMIRNTPISKSQFEKEHERFLIWKYYH